MAFNLKNRHFLKELDFTPQEIKFLLDLAFELKKAKYAGTEQPRLKGKNIVLLFEKDSTRTRCAFEVAALDQGAAAPAFAIDGAMGGEPFRFDLAQALKKGPVVLYFYPKAFTQGCTLEANAFAEAMDQYQALGATVIGVSGDDIATLKKFSVSECRGKFPVAADADRSVMKAYKAVMPQREDFAKRVSYVITPDSKIAYVYESGSFEEHVPRTLAALKSLDGGTRKP